MQRLHFKYRKEKLKTDNKSIAFITIIMLLILVVIFLIFSMGNDKSNNTASTDIPTITYDNDNSVFNTTDEVTHEDAQCKTHDFFEPYLIRLYPNTDIFNGPGYSYDVVSAIDEEGVYTITEEIVTESEETEKVWGRLKSGIGWVCIDDAITSDYSVPYNLDKAVTKSSKSSENNEKITKSQTKSFDNDKKITEPQPKSPVEDKDKKNTEPQPTSSAEDNVKVKSVVVNGVTFNYVSSYKFTSIDGDISSEYNIILDIKYCEPGEYITKDSKVTGIKRSSDTYSKNEIGDLYYSAYSAGYNDFAVFEISICGDYASNYIGEKNIEFREYTPYGALLKKTNGITDRELICIDKRAESDVSGKIDKKCYIGFFKSEVSQIDFKILAVGLKGWCEW